MSDEIANWPTGQVGFVSIVGRPNVGKSSFLNTVLDFHLSAVSNKPQTTRKNWRGILSDEKSQIVFIDTPGAHIGNSQLSETMLEDIFRTLNDVDVLLCMADPSREPGKEDKMIAERVAESHRKKILLINKIDIAEPAQIAETKAFYLEILDDVPVFEISAQDRKSLDPVLDAIRAELSTGPFFYDPEQVTDSYTRDIGAELIREASLNLLRKEVPHSIAIEIDQWKESENKLKIAATIFVERKSQKLIVIGKNGDMLKQIKRDAITALKDIIDVRIDLKLHVKVASDWRNKKDFMSNLRIINE
ncbi:MAG: GTPase Era [Lentisphaeria bacterium]|nr:GTPase Era [Lentisphaeria bacterium]NQZ69847.1 GTPase Era [Lentisphaeria bacterium]